MEGYKGGKSMKLKQSSKFGENIYQVVLDGKVGHISFTGRAEEIVLKTFLDFFMISRASKIYSIIY